VHSDHLVLGGRSHEVDRQVTVQEPGVGAAGRELVMGEDAKRRQATEEKVEAESLALYLSGRLHDDGIIDPRDTRDVLGMCLSAVHSNTVEGRRGFGVFRM
jgi:acetyl-CoA carboxylase carboxyltransferase component